MNALILAGLLPLLPLLLLLLLGVAEVAEGQSTVVIDSTECHSTDDRGNNFQVDVTIINRQLAEIRQQLYQQQLQLITELRQLRQETDERLGNLEAAVAKDSQLFERTPQREGQNASIGK